MHRDLGDYQKEYVPTSYKNAPALLIIVSRIDRPGTLIDSTMVRRDGLAPIWEVSRTGTRRTRYDYEGATVLRAITAPDTSVAHGSNTYPVPDFNFNELDELIRSIPLRDGFRTLVPLYSEGDNALEIDTVSVQGKAGDGAWSVRFADKVIVSHYEINEASRAIVRVEIERHADRSHFAESFARNQE